MYTYKSSSPSSYPYLCNYVDEEEQKSRANTKFTDDNSSWLKPVSKKQNGKVKAGSDGEDSDDEMMNSEEEEEEEDEEGSGEEEEDEDEDSDEEMVIIIQILLIIFNYIYNKNIKILAMLNYNIQEYE